MSHELSPAKVRLTDGLGPDALTYARERVSLLGAGEYVDTVNRALDAMDGLPVAALLGGWTFKGFTAWAQGLESEIARLTAALKRAQERDELLRAALAELLACHTESAGWSMSMLTNRAEFDEMIDRNQERLESAVGAARAALKEKP